MSHAPGGTGVPPVQDEPASSPAEQRPVDLAHPHEANDAVTSWLDGLVRVMRLPKRESDEIREELDSHVRDRVRDLMLVGESEPRAIHQAISELGDAALLAQRYKHARGISQRRWIMTAATFAIASSALVLSTMTLSGSPSPHTTSPASHNVAPFTAFAGAAVQSDGSRVAKVLKTTVEIDQGTTYREFFGSARKASRLIMDNAAFEQIDIDLDDAMGIDADGVTFAAVLEMVNRRIPFDTLALRATDGGVEITSQRVIDHVLNHLVVYDITDLMDNGVEPDQLTDLITTFVEPDQWLQNGGDLATYQIVAARLFIKAPIRFLPRIEWIMDQFDPESHKMDPEHHADAAVLGSR